MRPNRRFIQFLISSILLSCLAVFAAGGFTTWPFVAYDMYARRPLDHPRTYLFEGEDDAGHVFPLTDDAYFRPYLRQDFVAYLLANQSLDAVQANPLLDAFASSAARHASPLRALRVYRVSWSSEGSERRELMGERRWK